MKVLLTFFFPPLLIEFTEPIVHNHANLYNETFNKFHQEKLRKWQGRSPDLSPCDFHTIGSLKKALKANRLQLDEEAQHA